MAEKNVKRLQALIALALVAIGAILLAVGVGMWLNFGAGLAILGLALFGFGILLGKS